jgi:hypothetical protein
MEHSPHYDADRSSAIQDIFFLHLMESQVSLPRTCYELHYSRPRPAILVFMIHFNIALFFVR